MGDEEQRPARQVRTTAPRQEVIDYRFSVEIFVSQDPLDEKRVREIVDAEIRRLGAAIKNVK
jgi:hypothetical protein